MPTYAVLNSNIVSNLIVADTLKTAELVTKLTCVEYVTPPLVEIGFVYNFDTNTFTDPNVTEPIPEVTE